VLREVARVLEVPPAELLPESMRPVAADREDPAAKTIRLVLSGHPSLAAELEAGADGPAPPIDLEDLEARAHRRRAVRTDARTSPVEQPARTLVLGVLPNNDDVRVLCEEQAEADLVRAGCQVVIDSLHVRT
jgi:hypothetical protein